MSIKSTIIAKTLTKYKYVLSELLKLKALTRILPKLMKKILQLYQGMEKGFSVSKCKDKWTTASIKLDKEINMPKKLRFK